MALNDLVADGDTLFVSSGTVEPARLIDELVAEVAPRRRNLRFVQVLTGSQCRLGEALAHGHELLTPAPGRLRRRIGTGEVQLLDLSMRQIAAAIEAGREPVHGVLLTVVRVGDDLFPVPGTDLAMVALERARYRAVEVLPGWQVAPSGPRFSIGDADHVVDAEGEPGELRTHAETDVSRRIGEAIASLVPDGAVIELGVGRALASVAGCLAEAGRSVSVHTGLASDWTKELVERGVATRPLSCGHGRPVVAAIAMGSAGFNDWVRTSRDVTFAESRHAHDPAHLMSLGHFVAVNSAMAVDLRGQVGVLSEHAGTSPGGGLLDFAVAGAYSGASVIALPSRTDDGRSTIVDVLGAVHLPAGLVTHVVTEHGIAELRGKSPAARRASLLEIADSTAFTSSAPRKEMLSA